MAETANELEGENWTGTIPGYARDAIITFYMECFNNAGNVARTTESHYVVKAAPSEGGVPPRAEGCLARCLRSLRLLELYLPAKPALNLPSGQFPAYLQVGRLH